MYSFERILFLLTLICLCYHQIRAQNITDTDDDCEDIESGACFLVKERPYLCYNDNNKIKCCLTCKQLFTEITGCEYGNRRKGCDKRRCPRDNKIDPACCWTCGGYTTTSTTTTSTTTTTTEPPPTTTTTITTTTMASKIIDIFTPIKYWRKPKIASSSIKHGLNVAWDALKKTFLLDIDVKN